MNRPGLPLKSAKSTTRKRKVYHLKAQTLGGKLRLYSSYRALRGRLMLSSPRRERKTSSDRHPRSFPMPLVLVPERLIRRQSPIWGNRP